MARSESEARGHEALRITSAQADDVGRYIDLLEEVADWLARRGISQWRPGSFRLSADYYAESIRQGEVQLAFCGQALVGTLRLLLREPIDAQFPAPIGTLRLRRYERKI
jgi:hypothetical protein